MKMYTSVVPKGPGDVQYMALDFNVRKVNENTWWVKRTRVDATVPGVYAAWPPDSVYKHRDVLATTVSPFVVIGDAPEPMFVVTGNQFGRGHTVITATEMDELLQEDRDTAIRRIEGFYIPEIDSTFAVHRKDGGFTSEFWLASAALRDTDMPAVEFVWRFWRYLLEDSKAALTPRERKRELLAEGVEAAPADIRLMLLS